jgi:hypothetical protein
VLVLPQGVFQQGRHCTVCQAVARMKPKRTTSNVDMENHPSSSSKYSATWKRHL